MGFLYFLNAPHFNVYDFIILSILIQSLIFSALLLNRSDHHVSHYPLAAFIASIGLGQLCFLFLYHPIFSGLLSHIFNETGFALMTAVFFLQGPLLHAYIRTLTHSNFKIFRKDLGVLVVLLVAALASPLLWSDYLVNIFWRPFVLVSVIGFAVSSYYGAKALLFMRRFAATLKNHFSNLEHLNLIWLKVFSGGFLLIWCLEILPPFFYGRVPWWLEEIITHMPGLLSLCMMNFVFFKGMANSRRFRKLENLVSSAVDAEDAKHKHGTESINLASLKADVDQRIRTEFLFARPHLNIDRLAQLLGIPARQLSNLINKEFHQNYFEFINAYRLEEVKARLSSPQWRECSVQQIYESVGFCSKSTFFTLFRKDVGMTPSAYREEYLAKN